MTWADYQRLLHGYNTKRIQGAEDIRLLCYYSVMIHIEPSKRPSIQDFMPFAWDVKEDGNNENLLKLIKEVQEAYKN